jgi:hypothetical protein
MLQRADRRIPQYTFVKNGRVFFDRAYSGRPKQNLTRKRPVVAMARKVAHRCSCLILLVRKNIPIKAMGCKRSFAETFYCPVDTA